MAKVIINGAQFRPFTMDELLRPLALATEEHHRIEDQQNAMAEEAAMWDWLLPQTGEARNAYNTWNENLRAQVDALNANGLSPQVRQQMTSLRRTSPIKALTYANEQLQNEMRIRAQRGDNAVYEKPNLTIDDFWRGATPNNNYRDLSQITQQTSNAVQAYARTIQSSPNFQRAIGSNGQYFDISQTQGVPYAVIQAAFDPTYTPANDQERDALNQIRNIVNSQRGDRFSQYDAVGQSKIDNAIYQGLLTGSEVTTHQLQQDRSLERSIAQRKANRDDQLFNFQWKVEDGRIVGINEDYEVMEARQRGMVPEYDESGNIKRDKSGNIIYRRSPSSPSSRTNNSGNGNQLGYYGKNVRKVRVKTIGRRPENIMGYTTDINGDEVVSGTPLNYDNDIFVKDDYLNSVEPALHGDDINGFDYTLSRDGEWIYIVPKATRKNPEEEQVEGNVSSGS